MRGLSLFNEEVLAKLSGPPFSFYVEYNGTDEHYVGDNDIKLTVQIINGSIGPSSPASVVVSWCMYKNGEYLNSESVVGIRDNEVIVPKDIVIPKEAYSYKILIDKGNDSPVTIKAVASEYIKYNYWNISIRQTDENSNPGYMYTCEYIYSDDTYPDIKFTSQIVKQSKLSEFKTTLISQLNQAKVDHEAKWDMLNSNVSNILSGLN
jgi:hypothetical protein